MKHEIAHARERGLTLLEMLIVLTLILSAFHDFVLGPRAGAPGADSAARLRASWLARINVLVALVIVLLGLSLLG